MHLDKNYHAISLIMYSEIKEEEKQEIKNMEPNKCEKWLWVTFNQLRNQANNLFYPLQDFLNKHPKMNSVEYLRKLAWIPSIKSLKEDEEKKKKKESISSQRSDSPFYSSTQGDESILSKDELML